MWLDFLLLFQVSYIKTEMGKKSISNTCKALVLEIYLSDNCLDLYDYTL